MNRRSFLVAASLSSGAFLVGCASGARQQLRDSSLMLTQGQIALNGWIKLNPEGKVSLMMPKSEMGQGVQTALMMLVAEELDCGWPAMQFENAGIDPLYGNVAGLAEGVPFRPDDQGSLARSVRWVMHTVMRQMGFMMTGGSSSIKDLWIPLREAAALTRASLVQTVANEWKVGAEQVRLQDGRFTRDTPPAAPASTPTPSSNVANATMTMADAVRLLGAKPRPASSFTLKSPAQFRLIGTDVPRNDALSKTIGQAQFGIDVRLPGMLYAAVQMSPVRGGRVKRFDSAKATGMRGVVKVVSFEGLNGGSGGVAVIADQYWRARTALKEVKTEYDAGPMAEVSSNAVYEQLGKALDEKSGFNYWKVGDAAEVIANSATTLKAEYRAPYLAHATLEPMNCTVLVETEKVQVWVPSQVPGFARKAVAKALDVDEKQIEVNLTYLGGGFGRRLEVDFIAQAAQIGKAVPGKPVQVLWSREEDTKHDFYRPACVSRFSAGFDAQGQLTAWQNTSAGQAIVPGFLPRNAGIPGMGPDKTASEGAFDQAYEFPVVKVAHVTVDLPVPVGFWRAVGHSHQAFFKEGFLDECAAQSKTDPLAFRLNLLQKHPRQKAVLELAASKAGWGTPLGTARDGAKMARGIALHESFGSIVAQVAEVSLDADKQIRVHRVVCAVDCGLAVNPNIIRQQIESSVIFGLSAALYGNIDIEKGAVQQSNFHDYELLRLAESPTIETHIVKSSEAPEGIGEPGLPPIAPAVANALFALTGQRLRSLPLRMA